MRLLKLPRPLERTLEPESMDTPELARLYDKVAKAHALLDRLFARRIAGLGVARGRALDVGCGSGLLSIELTQRTPGLHILAVDLSSAMLELARRNAQQAHAERIEFVRADAKSLPFARGTFDVVFSQHTLHHLPDPQALLVEMERVARAGGYVLVRDLRRPRWGLAVKSYVRILGAVYNRLGDDSTLAKSLYRASLNAALSRAEWAQLAECLGIGEAAVTNVPLLRHTDIVFRKSPNSSPHA